MDGWVRVWVGGQVVSVRKLGKALSRPHSPRYSPPNSAKGQAPMHSTFAQQHKGDSHCSAPIACPVQCLPPPPLPRHPSSRDPVQRPHVRREEGGLVGQVPDTQGLQAREALARPSTSPALGPLVGTGHNTLLVQLAHVGDDDKGAWAKKPATPRGGGGRKREREQGQG